ncbi:MAG: hypothetical protein LBS38_03335 [Endomicrobium sp.]|nr:hypothetical protein [Endomicrobium sp.]MDR2399039.1 hypothetical protein [Endomicrobium sp.]
MDSLTLRIFYADTVQIGMGYYTNYPTFFELGRTLEYKAIEENRYIGKNLEK